jgi:TonB family protein
MQCRRFASRPGACAKAWLGLTVFAVGAGLAMSAPDVSSTVSAEAFTPPKLIHIDGAYPGEALDESREGWVRLGFMVSAAGKPYAITVLGSSGGPLFVDAATRKLKGATFEPGTLDGRPVDSDGAIMFPFIIRGIPRTVRPIFYGSYERLLSAVRKKDAVRAEKELKLLQPTSLTEDAYYALGQFHYASAWGTEADELVAVKRALLDAQLVSGGPFPPGFAHFHAQNASQLFSPAATRALELTALELQINLHRYAGALETWKWLEQHGIDAANRARLAPAIAQIEHVKSAHLGYSTAGVIGASEWQIRLFEPQFSITHVAGLIVELRLYCQGGYLKFHFDPTLQYRVHGEYGTCRLHVDGQPGTRFTLNQF